MRKLLEPKHLASVLSLLVLLVASAVGPGGFWLSAASAAFLGISVMLSVHHAEIIAHRIGEGLGTLVLAICVTVIEVGLILMLMAKLGPEGAGLARDTVFAAVMIIMNGIVGLCLVLGGLKFSEQEFRIQGSQSLLVVLVTLATLVFILPNYTTTTVGPTYNEVQMIFTAAVCVVLYLIFVFFQTTSHKAYFEPVVNDGEAARNEHVVHEVSAQDAWLSFASLCICLVAVIGLAKLISPMIEQGIVYLGAPKSTVGILIAAIVLLPEALAAMNAARANRLQTSLNLALGSGVASIALTVPVVIAYTLFTSETLALGLGPKNSVFLVMTMLVSVLTLGTGKSTLLQGAVHIVILLAYLTMFLFLERNLAHGLGQAYSK